MTRLTLRPFVWLSAALRLAAACSTLGAAASARADEPRRSEPAPVEELGPPVCEGEPGSAAITARGAQIEIEPSRRSAVLHARWEIALPPGAPPGPLRLAVPSTLFRVDFRLADAAGAESPLTAEVEAREPGPAPAEFFDLRVDPTSGRVYARDKLAPADAPPVHRPFLHHLSVALPPGGRAVLHATAVLSSGFDRHQFRRSAFEQGHLLHDRKDFFVYQFAARGPQGGPETLGLLPLPPRTAARATWADDGTLRAAAMERRAIPLAATVGLGLAISPEAGSGQSPPEPGKGRVEGLVRLAADLLLPWRDALSLAAELGSNLQAGHHLGFALTYELHSPAFSYLPIAGHLDLGGVCDAWQTYFAGNLRAADSHGERCGPRLGLSVLAKFVGLSLSADLFPYKVSATLPAPPTEPSSYAVRYRIGLLATVGL